jgi:hypothetical protein
VPDRSGQVGALKCTEQKLFPISTDASSVNNLRCRLACWWRCHGDFGSQGVPLGANYLAASILVDWKQVRMVVPMASVLRLFLVVIQVVAWYVRWCFMLVMCASCVVLCLWLIL